MLCVNAITAHGMNFHVMSFCSCILEMDTNKGKFSVTDQYKIREPICANATFIRKLVNSSQSEMRKSKEKKKKKACLVLTRRILLETN